MVRINILIAVIVAAVTYGFLAYINRPEIEPMWPVIIKGFSFSTLNLRLDTPFRLFTSFDIKL
ncbi:MAG: hypothetical protein RQ783_09640 [Gammaproteobacteria bacterium]|nr:hypothetical protein [Gammaproteobacteria bacterium]